MNNTLTQSETNRNPELAQSELQTASICPRVNITADKDGYRLEAELPGVNKDGLEILLEDNELTLIGRRTSAAAAGEVVYRESSPRDFRRVFTLDPSIDASKIEARLEDGVLRLHLPKAERVKPRKITVAA
jgi:HSP20 family protein